MSAIMNGKDLKRTEQSAFRAAVDTGLWDVLIATVLAMFAIGPMLSVHLGDFWSSAVFVPVWVAVYFALRVVQERWVVPRVGIVRFGPRRTLRLRRLALTALVVNIVAFALGLFAATRSGPPGSDLYPVGLALVLLAGFSVAAYFLGIPRYFLYGLLLGGAPLAGEALFRRGYATHHGFPVVFGVAAVVILSSGLLRFARHVVRAGPGVEGAAGEDSSG